MGSRANYTITNDIITSKKTNLSYKKSLYIYISLFIYLQPYKLDYTAKVITVNLNMIPNKELNILLPSLEVTKDDEIDYFEIYVGAACQISLKVFNLK